MCGIAGIFAAVGSRPGTLDELQSMIAMLGHRGPDGYGTYCGDRVGLAHARLSLIDLTGGFQPLHNEAGSSWLTFNGEIFNYLELRQTLIRRGHRFYTKGDGEVILHCYDEFGERAWAMLNGQFAFALWDGRRRKLWLVRDRLGILPLFYTRVGSHLVFASEAKALFAGGRIAPRFDGHAIAEVFTCWSAAGPATVFEGVRSVCPGTAIAFDEALAPTECRYWQPAVREAAISSDDAAAMLEWHLARAVALRLRADVPVGCYISGGLDSSLIGCLARAQISNPLDTFSIRFTDPRFDESVEQRQIVQHLGSRHLDVLCGPEEIVDTLAEVVWHCESPLLRSGPVPLFLLAQLVRQAGLKAVLAGEGADELLAGYSIFKEDQVRRYWARYPESTRRGALLQRVHEHVVPESIRTGILWQHFFRQGLTATEHPFYSHLIRWRNSSWTIRLLSPELVGGFDFHNLISRFIAEMPADWRVCPPLARAQLIEMRSFLSPYLLAFQGDRVAMAHGVEVRYPFLDPELVDFCLSLPKAQKLLGLREKIVLRRVAQRYLPPGIAQRRKQPYRAPIWPILTCERARDLLDPLLSPRGLARTGLIDTRIATQLLEKARRQDGRLAAREEMGLLGVITLQQLASHFMDNFSVRVRERRTRLSRLQRRIEEGKLIPNAANGQQPSWRITDPGGSRGER